jgi:protein-L-isoaspartate(D-aspartate) O-methyltransferase
MTFPHDHTQCTNLIDGLLAPNSVNDPALLDAIRAVARESFVPDAFRTTAYVDDAIPLAGGRALLEPLVQARLLQALSLKPHESLLIIGGTTGYTAALASYLAARVELVEDSPELVARAQASLAASNRSNVNVAQHPLTHGAPGAAPYDAILIEGAVEQIPDTIFAQLKEDGRLVAVLENPKARGPLGCGTASLYEKHDGQISARPLFDAGVAPLPGFLIPTGFEFNA